ncbi:hypothetical protein [Parapedobacter lycopersici]|uniref:hypothetical protein n=1 Tax=Parapedobacter lycopersici TaxID=1864939 RepID=UPI00214D6124|nr:hypothetical protein [Parapedobacter lycopersici]
MKKLTLAAFCGLLMLAFQFEAKAQSYRTGAGLFIDAGDGRTFVGPHLKHFFSANNAGQFMILFADRTTLIGAEYSYNQGISGANGLSWYIGIGPQVAIRKENSEFAIRPLGGLEFKIPSAPIAASFDWRPLWALGEYSDFIPGRFGIGFKFTF